MEHGEEKTAVWQEMAEAGNAQTMIIRKEQMPELLKMAQVGNPDAIFQMLMVEGALGFMQRREYRCIFCQEKTDTDLLGMIVFVGKEIARGKQSIFCLVCEACETPDDKVNSQIMEHLQFTKIVHESGHA